MLIRDKRVEGERTVVRPRDEPEAAIVLGGVLQGDPKAHHPAQRGGVQERSVLMRSHWGVTHTSHTQSLGTHSKLYLNCIQVL